MSVDISVTAGCGCFVTHLGPAGVAVAMCKGHTARAVAIFDREPAAVDGLLTGVYGEGLQRVEALLVAWDQITRGEPPTTRRIRAAIAGVHEDGSST